LSHASSKVGLRPALLDCRNSWQFPTRRFPARHDGIDLGQTAPLITQTATYPLAERI